MTAAAAAAPTGVIGNLRFTAAGVYAEYLLSGLPFVFASREVQDQVADVHAELLRALPSGAMLAGLTAPADPKASTRRMLFAHPDLDPGAAAGAEVMPPHTEAWVAHCRRWAAALGARRHRRRIFWLSLPLDHGAGGAGGWRHRVDTALGRDRDSAAALAHYRDRAAAAAARIPPVLSAKPAGVEQIWWHWNYLASRHSWREPMPSTPYAAEARLPAAAFDPVWLDPSAAQQAGRRWFAARRDAEVFVRTFRGAASGTPDSYQAIVGLERYPDGGLRWPTATMFKVLDDLSTPDVTLDWSIHLTFDTEDVAVATAHNVITNVRDQARQLGRHADADDELARRLASGRQLASALKSGAAERGVNPAVLITAAAADPATLDAAITDVIRRYRSQRLDLVRRRGSQAARWCGTNPGTEARAALHEIRSPSTVASFAKFVPLLATGLGNNVGVPLGETLTSGGLRQIVFNDLVGAPGRNNPGNLVIGGSPGRGKSQCAKNLIRSWLEMGAGMTLIDPTTAREHQLALTTFPADRTLVIDARRPRFSLDGLRIFTPDDAAERTVDQLLPQLGFAPFSTQAARLKALLEPGFRAVHGIGSLGRLIALLAAPGPDRVAADGDLLVALEGLRAERLLAPMFDETLPVPDLSRQLIIWNFGGLTLPTVTEEYQAHLHRQSTPAQRAAQALYGLAADLAQSRSFARPTVPDVLVVEECAAWTHSPGGQRCANTIIRQGRKAWTLFVGISQSPREDFGVLEDEFIEQRICLGFKTSDIAEDTLRWCGRDLHRHPQLLTDYVTNTSPAQVLAYGDEAIDARHGRVVPGREGEAWVLDEFGGWGKVRLFGAPTAELAELYDSNPQRRRARERRAPV